MTKGRALKGLLVLLAVTVAAGAYHAVAGSAQEQVNRTYDVVMRFAQATVAEVDTIAVVNLPADLWMRAGETVAVRVKNESPIPEGFAIDELGVKEVLQPGETRTIVLRNAKPGAYTIYCQLHPLGVHHTGTLLVLN